MSKQPSRKAINKKARELVYSKYNGHCAYCGCIITLKEMQVDHKIPFRNIKAGKNTEAEVECFGNLVPACRPCNYYKRAKSIETFRRELSKILSRLRKMFIYRLAVKYNFIKELPHKVKFYFEEENIND